MKTIAFIFCLFPFSILHAVCPSGYFTMHCRGGGGIILQNLEIGASNSSYNYVRGTFKRNIYGFVNPVGAAISPGHCAWLDRPVYTTEPDQFEFPVFKDHVPAQNTKDFLNNCAPHSSCSFSFCAQNVGDAPLRFYLNEITTIYDSTP